MQVGTPRQFRWLKGVIASVLVLNLLDAVFTLVWVFGLGVEEKNPAMAGLLATHPVLFVLVKTTLVALGSWLLWRFRRRPLAVVGIFVVFLFYYWLLIAHLSAMNVGLFQRQNRVERARPPIYTGS